MRGRSISLPLLAVIGVVEVVVVVLALGVYRYTRPLPAPEIHMSAPSVLEAPPAAVGIPWPAQGQAALWIEGFGVIGTRGEGTPVPIASITKVMTALVILDEHELALGDTGPEIAITFAHEEAFLAAILNDESAVPVQAGFNPTLEELLQGVLVASGNNLARILAEWDSGSETDFVAKMNGKAQQLGLRDTRFTDASGLDDGNISTPRDLLRLAEIAMANPVFTNIVTMEEVEFPGVGTLSNTNVLLGTGNIVGIKTGETDEAGACLLVAARVPTAGGERLVLGVVLGQPERQGVFDASREMMNASGSQVVRVDVTNEGGASVAYGEPIATVITAWGEAAFVSAAGALSVTALPSTELTITTVVDAIEPGARAGDVVGLLEVTGGEEPAQVPLVLVGNLPGPDWQWRLRRN